MVSQELIQEIINRMAELPETPSVAFQVSKLLDDPEISAQDLAKVILMDPMLTAQVLKICNSAEYGFSRKIATISEAVSILGYQVLKRVIFTIISHGYLNRTLEGYALEKGALWENSVTCGVYARSIAQRQNFKDPELVFIGALLRDIGKIAIETYVNGRGGEITTMVRDAKCSFVEAEEKVVGVSHTIVGAALADHWKLPDSLVNVVRYHHQPSELPLDSGLQNRQLVAIVHLADALTMMTGTGLGIDGLMYPLDNGVFEVLGLKPDGQTLETLYAALLDLHDEIRVMSTALAIS
jgi:putative nucleotidyltransferase with HDIG domain